jgi:hypothetical protein
MPAKAAKQQEKCGLCAKAVTKDDHGVLCEICNIWYHCKCHDISDNLYDAINQFNHDIHWFCKACRVGTEKMFGILSQLQSKIESLENDIIALKDETVHALSKVETRITTAIQELRSEMQNQLKSRIQSELLVHVDSEISKAHLLLEHEIKSLTQAEKPNNSSWSDIVNKAVDSKFEQMDTAVKQVQTSVAEQNDKLQREFNIVIYNAPEDRTDDKTDWYKREIDFCLHLFNDGLKIPSLATDIEKTYRLGKRTEANLSRPLLVKLRSKITKNQIMESVKSLKNAPEPLNKIIVSHDMTKNEREICKKLVVEAKKLEADDDSGEWIFRVRGVPSQLKIVKLRRNRLLH